MGEHTGGQDGTPAGSPVTVKRNTCSPILRVSPLPSVRRIVEQDASLLQLEDLLDTSNVNPPVWAFE